LKEEAEKWMCKNIKIFVISSPVPLLLKADGTLWHQVCYINKKNR